MHILLAGGTGLIGRALVDELLTHDHTVVLLTRSLADTARLVRPGVTLAAWDGRSGGSWTASLEATDAVVNLAGATIAKRWTTRQKERILSSRIESTRTIVEALSRGHRRPRILVNASAVGYYGNVPKGDVTEELPRGQGFLSDVCVEWEQTAEKLLRGVPDARVVVLRTGIVLDPRAGALKKLITPFRFFAGGSFGSGRQGFPWIHLADEVGAIRFLIEHPSASGPANLAAPGCVTMSEFCRALGHVLHRPSWLPVPGIALRMGLGEMAGPLLLEGQRIVPKRLLELGYRFRHPALEAALRDLLTKP